MSAQPIRKGATHKVVIGGFYDKTDGFTPETGILLTGGGSADDTAAVLHDNGTIVDISGYTWNAISSAPGHYHLTLQTGISNTVGHLTIVVQDDSVCLPVWKDFVVMDTEAYDTLYAATSTIQTSFDIGLIIQGAITTVTGQQEFILDSAIAVDNSWIGHEVALEDVSTGHLYASNNGQGIWVTDVIASSNTVKISSIFPVTVVTTDQIRIYVSQHPQYIIDTFDPPTRTEATADKDSILAKLLAYVRLIARKDAGPTTDDATELTAINADDGAGAGSYAAGDALEATQDDVTTVLTDTADMQPKVAKIPLSDGSISWNVTALNAVGDVVWDENIVSAHGSDNTSGLILSQLSHRALVTSWSADVTAGSLLDYMADDGTATFDRTTDSLQAIRDNVVSDILTTQMTESYAADGVAPTLAQALFFNMQLRSDFIISGVTYTVRKLDGTTTAYTLTLTDAEKPTGATRAT